MPRSKIGENADKHKTAFQQTQNLRFLECKTMIVKAATKKWERIQSA